MSPSVLDIRDIISPRRMPKVEKSLDVSGCIWTDLDGVRDAR